MFSVYLNMFNTFSLRGSILKSGFLFAGILLVFCQCSTPVDEAKADETCDEDACCESSTESSETSEITCPKCGHKATETLPTQVCQIKYNCKKCDTLLMPKEGDCCVFCTYGTHKCPSMQEDQEEEVMEPVQQEKKKQENVLPEKEVAVPDMIIYDPLEDPDYIGTPCGDYDQFGNCRRHNHHKYEDPEDLK